MEKEIKVHFIGLKLRGYNNLQNLLYETLKCMNKSRKYVPTQKSIAFYWGLEKPIKVDFILSEFI